jgi:hypothetical protein
MSRALASLSVAIGLLSWNLAHADDVPRTFDPPRVGTNYYTPAETFTGAKRWTWLMRGVYTRPNETTAVSPRQQFTSDLDFIRDHDVGRLHRLWINLDSLCRQTGEQSGFTGFDPQALANVDDALTLSYEHSISVDLVLLSYSKATVDLYQFHPEALDGAHASMREGYLTAIASFVRHLSNNPDARSTVAVIDLQNEAYYQLEQYYGTASDGSVILPWVRDLYAAAHAAAPMFSYTVSDTGRLLDTSLMKQRQWEEMYPVDVFDIHLYDDAPWENAQRYANGRLLSKPWFTGEAGCASGHTACTYSGDDPVTVKVDQWWLENAPRMGAKAVLIEDRSTAWKYPSGPGSPALTEVGNLIALHSP